MSPIFVVEITYDFGLRIEASLIPLGRMNANGIKRPG